MLPGNVGSDSYLDTRFCRIDSFLHEICNHGKEIVFVENEFPGSDPDLLRVFPKLVPQALLYASDSALRLVHID